MPWAAGSLAGAEDRGGFTHLDGSLFHNDSLCVIIMDC
jgi:hypothetical protein